MYCMITNMIKVTLRSKWNKTVVEAKMLHFIIVYWFTIKLLCPSLKAYHFKCNKVIKNRCNPKAIRQERRKTKHGLKVNAFIDETVSIMKAISLSKR